MADNDRMEKLVSLAKRRGFVFQSSEIYGGLGSVWDYGPLGVELKRNIKDRWWKRDGPRARRHRGARRGHPDVAEGVGGVGPRGGLHRSAGGLQALQAALPGRRPADQGDAGAARRAVPGVRDARLAHRAADVQPDVQDVHGPGRGGRGGGLPAAGDGAGDLRQLPQRAAGLAAEDPVRHRADRQGVPQRDHAGELHLPHPRVRADGDAVLRAAGHGRGVVRVLAERADAVARGARAASRSGCASTSTRRTSWRTTPRRRTTSSTSSRSGGTSSRGSTTARTSTCRGTSRRRARSSSTSTRSGTSATSRTSWRRRWARTARRWRCCATRTTRRQVEGETRVVLRLKPALAPIKAAVLPLVKKDGMPEIAQKIYDDLRGRFTAFYDDGGSIGRRYRRQDEAGTPFAITVDGQTTQDGTVTVRHRDTLAQERVDAARPGRLPRRAPRGMTVEELRRRGEAHVPRSWGARATAPAPASRPSRISRRSSAAIPTWPTTGGRDGARPPRAARVGGG